MAARSVTRMIEPARPGQLLLQGLMLAALLGPLAACTTGGAPAPVEGRTPGGPTKSTAVARPSGASPAAAPATAAGTRVFALPDESGPAAAPVPMDEAIPVPVPVPLPAEPVFEDPALRELIAQVDAAQSRGDSAAARATLERAVKIKPREAALWLRLADLSYAGGDFEQALVTAQRARDLAGSDTGTKARADDLIRRAQQGTLQ
ncbi:MAG: tetratricopeptide repeat protein [Gammaproteobacteria bacterium]|nr:tetratricopeptide repeat protein [Gammaproteobacteria bacterium]